ncbi:hypothetical protein EMCRGX_G002817 [Ephydatia muelleri]
MSVPTDCDQRDERLGWMGDVDLSSDSMLLNFHMDSFLPHYTQLMADDKVKGPDVVQCCTGVGLVLLTLLGVLPFHSCLAITMAT